MIDLNKLDKEIDELFENETSDSLTKWLLNKRFGNINKLIGPLVIPTQIFQGDIPEISIDEYEK